MSPYDHDSFFLEVSSCSTGVFPFCCCQLLAHRGLSDCRGFLSIIVRCLRYDIEHLEVIADVIWRYCSVMCFMFERGEILHCKFLNYFLVEHVQHEKFLESYTHLGTAVWWGH